MDQVPRNPLSTITNTVSTPKSTPLVGKKRLGPKSKTEAVVEKLIKLESSEKRNLRIAKEVLEPDLYKFNVRGSYKGQVWLVKTDPDDLQLKVTTLNGYDSICKTYKKINDGSEDFSYNKPNCPERFSLLFEIEFIELVGCGGVHAASNAAEAWSFLVSRLIKYQYRVNKDEPKKYLPFFKKSKNDQTFYHAQHFGCEEKVIELLVKLRETDIFTIEFKKLHEVFANLNIKFHFYQTVKCTRESLQNLITRPTPTSTNPKIKERPNARPEKYKCHLCATKFELSQNLNAHLRNIHESEPVKCSHCTYKCYSTLILKRHMDKHSKQIICVICQRPFSAKHNLTKHTKKCHSKSQ